MIPLTTALIVVNGIIVAGLGDYPNGARKLFSDHHYECPEILAILEEDLNVLAGGKCWNNRKGFPGKDDNITLPRGCERGTSKRLYNRGFHIVATRWKDSKTIQFISSLRKLEKKNSPDGDVKK